MSSSSRRGAGVEGEPTKPCPACTDFKSRMKSYTQKITNGSEQPKNSVGSKTGSLSLTEEALRSDCPLDKSELGNSTWSFLHTMAAYYPDHPTASQQSDMKSFIKTFSQFYPCDYCADDLRKDLKKNEPNVSSSHGLSQYFCELHNRVNFKLGKPEFDCSKVKQRWRDGWPDGRCD